MPTCLIALGSNVNASEEVFRKAMQELQRCGAKTLAISRIVTTRPVGTQAGSLYLNAAATVESHLTPIDLLRALHQVESAFGRTRDVHWGPRTLDLDLLLYGEERIDQPDLVVPHPAMWYRRFVLDPLVELIPDVVHPVFRQTIQQLRERLLQRPLPVCTITRTSGSRSSSSQASANSSRIALFIALRTSGRLLINQPTGPCRSTSKCS